ncbi:MAG: hypothetical protein ACHREM_09535 [Polyangiales bacterium]
MGQVFSSSVSQPTDSVWNLGLPLLADQIARARPGPVVLHQDPSTDVTIAQVYGFLFAPVEVPLHRQQHLALYVHPRRFERLREWQPPVDLEEPTHAEFMGGVTGPLAEYVRSRAPREVIRDEEPPWVRSMQLSVDQALADVASSGSATAYRAAAQSGASNALSLIEAALKNGGPT